ncbi:hypothetical protein ACTWJ8_05030 [Streptomyces sp. SDT5-1]|uniref:hypothetical protein n=1 Tax=Streptomyces sp. SDT5-1 TaxID=3406418 RepID=UPI003FD2BBA1
MTAGAVTPVVVLGPVDRTVDWQRLAAHHWDRRPALLRGAAPFDPHEVFEGAVAAAQHTATERVRLTVGRRLLTDPGDLLPRPEDGSFTAYDRRVQAQLRATPFTLTTDSLHTDHHPLWARERTFLAQLWTHVGQPLPAIGTTLHHGTAAPCHFAPAAPAATFLYALHGRHHLHLTAPDGTHHCATVTPGDLLYWPADHTPTVHPPHSPATTVRITIPRTPPPPLDSAPPPPSQPTLLVPDGSPPDDLPATLPPALSSALGHLRRETRPAPLRRRLAREALRHATDAGLRPVPPPARPGYFTDDDAVRAVERVVWMPAGGHRYVAACGHVTRTDLPPRELTPLLTLLNTGAPVPIADLPPPARRLLSLLSGFRAVERL